MAFLKSLVFLLAVVAVALAIEGVREKKHVLLGLADDGSWWPGKYDPVAIHTAYPAYHPAVPALRNIYW